jgi:uncharacterized protein (DUF1330 family)
MKYGFYVLSMVCAFALGAVTFGTSSGKALADKPEAMSTDELPAYMIVSGKRLKPPEAMAAYRQAAGPLARAAGYQLLATQPTKANVQVLEGEWNYDGFLLVEKYTSMQSLLKFWNSPEYQAAKKLREGAVKMDFIVAIEGSR